MLDYLCCLDSDPACATALSGTIYLDHGKTLTVNFKRPVSDEGQAAEIVTAWCRKNKHIQPHEVVGCMVVPKVNAPKRAVATLSDLVEPRVSAYTRGDTWGQQLLAG
jgi:hypothetical protein